MTIQPMIAAITHQKLDSTFCGFNHYLLLYDPDGEHGPPHCSQQHNGDHAQGEGP